MGISPYTTSGEGFFGVELQVLTIKVLLPINYLPLLGSHHEPHPR